ncbi:MAG TPA: 2-oxoglutarate and iron-dependent oxygenase domain-containing protein [Beijerinckiaceae bacterium]|jgi:isopenicillin N synthase-like dioxygenase|nr:2-oxoglutarate and iron-dependent oxygenase domain-containing protein [Beijerinckiaceae bacterium]
MHLYEPPKAAKTIPLIDLARAFDAGGAQAVAWDIHRACRETGFFYIIGHGVPAALMERHFQFAKAFFDLPHERKMAIHMKKSPTTAGYEPVGGQVLDSQDDKAKAAPPDLKESFYSGMELPDDHPWAIKHIRNFGHNQWPEELPEFRAHMIDYWAEMRSLGDRLLALLALSLDLPANWFGSFFDMPSGTARLIKYPPQPENALFNQIGAGAHTDWGGVTILAQDATGGLEVRNADGDWIEAPPIDGSFVINLGDLMARWTNGLYNSNFHRVKNNRSGHDRYSAPFFYSPRPDAMIDAVPGSITAGHPRRFEACTAYEHTAEMFRRSYGYAPKAVS